MELNGIFGSQWYTVRLNFTIQSTIEKFTFDVSMVLNGTERYRTVLNGIEWYLNGIPLADFDEIFYY